jgi:ABC-2 type transport system permease protein
MLIDALKSESYRLSRNWIQVVFATLVVPVLFIVGGAFILFQAEAKGGPMAMMVGINPAAPAAPLNLMEALTFGADKGANGFTLILMLIAAATLYVGDYRWETWRLISARNSRTSLLLGKVAVMKGLAFAGMAAFLVAAIIFNLMKAGIFDRSLTFSADGSDWGQFALLWLLSWTRIIQFSLIALLTGVLTRSLLAALFVPWALGFAQSLAGQILPALGWDPASWKMQLLLPGLAYDTLKAAVQGAPAAKVWPALSGLALWTLAPLIGALALFNRQDLSKE